MVLNPVLKFKLILNFDLKINHIKRLIITSAIAFIGLSSFAQVSFDAKTNHEQEKAYGLPVVKTVTDSKTENSVDISVEVMLKKPILMGCQYIYRITNKSTDKTAKVTTDKYADQFQLKGEKIKPGEAIDFLVNTMSRCEGKSGYEKCIDCQPMLTITKVDFK